MCFDGARIFGNGTCMLQASLQCNMVYPGAAKLLHQALQGSKRGDLSAAQLIALSPPYRHQEASRRSRVFSGDLRALPLLRVRILARLHLR